VLQIYQQYTYRLRADRNVSSISITRVLLVLTLLDRMINQGTLSATQQLESVPNGFPIVSVHGVFNKSFTWIWRSACSILSVLLSRCSCREFMSTTFSSIFDCV